MLEDKDVRFGPQWIKPSIFQKDFSTFLFCSPSRNVLKSLSKVEGLTHLGQKYIFRSQTWYSCLRSQNVLCTDIKAPDESHCAPDLVYISVNQPACRWSSLKSQNVLMVKPEINPISRQYDSYQSECGQPVAMRSGLIWWQWFPSHDDGINVTTHTWKSLLGPDWSTILWRHRFKYRGGEVTYVIETSV